MPLYRCTKCDVVENTALGAAAVKAMCAKCGKILDDVTIMGSHLEFQAYHRDCAPWNKDARIAELDRVMTLAKDLIVSGYAMEAAAELERALEPTPVHASDCALHNEPAIPVGPCDCGEEKSKI